MIVLFIKVLCIFFIWQFIHELDFSSNQLFEQAPGDNAEISLFCKLNYGTTFMTFGKIDVNASFFKNYISS